MLSYADKLKSAILNLFAVKKEGLISQESNYKFFFVTATNVMILWAS